MNNETKEVFDEFSEALNKELQNSELSTTYYFLVVCHSMSQEQWLIAQRLDSKGEGFVWNLTDLYKTLFISVTGKSEVENADELKDWNPDLVFEGLNHISHILQQIT